MDSNNHELRYLNLLAEGYPSIQAASAAIVKLTARLQLPKGTEHYVSDIHGEHEAFRHVLKNASGSIRRKIDEAFGETLTEQERRNLATLIYYPRRKLPLALQAAEDRAAWCRTMLQRLILIARIVSAKYTRAAVRACMPDQLAPIMEELLLEQEGVTAKHEYYQGIIDATISVGNAGAIIIALAELIQRLAIDRLHVIGDVYDRGPGAHLIMDTLMDYHRVDAQWGNHDILWMGAAAGSEACMANVIRISLRYGNMETLENGYGISLLPLASFAMDTYGAEACQRFAPKATDDPDATDEDRLLIAQMHKAIAIIQFKLEAQIIMRRPHYQMEDRLLLDKIDQAAGTVRVGGVDYPLLDSHLPTIDPENPYALAEREQIVVQKLAMAFAGSQRLQQHVRFLFAKGGMYLAHNGNLLYHGCMPMEADGSFSTFLLDGEEVSCRDLLDRIDRVVRQGYFAGDDPSRKQLGLDTMWYLWSGARSPLFGKSRMATFERYFIADKRTHSEVRNPYYDFRDEEATARRILAEFDLDPDSGHIFNGHVPVKVKRGESPVKAGGKLIVIDGGFSKAYQAETGIAGYTLVYNSYGLLLSAHHPFQSAQTAIEQELDIDSRTEILENNTIRKRIRDTDQGREIQQRIDDLKALIDAYRDGLIKER